MTYITDFEIEEDLFPEKKKGPESSDILFSSLALMIEDTVEREYIAVVKFTGKKLSKGHAITSMKILKQGAL